MQGKREKERRGKREIAGESFFYQLLRISALLPCTNRVLPDFLQPEGVFQPPLSLVPSQLEPFGGRGGNVRVQVCKDYLFFLGSSFHFAPFAPLVDVHVRVLYLVSGAELHPSPVEQRGGVEGPARVVTQHGQTSLLRPVIDRQPGARENPLEISVHERTMSRWAAISSRMHSSEQNPQCLEGLATVTRLSSSGGGRPAWQKPYSPGLAELTQVPHHPCRPGD